MKEVIRQTQTDHKGLGSSTPKWWSETESKERRDMVIDKVRQKEHFGEFKRQSNNLIKQYNPRCRRVALPARTFQSNGPTRIPHSPAVLTALFSHVELKEERNSMANCLPEESARCFRFIPKSAVRFIETEIITKLSKVYLEGRAGLPEQLLTSPVLS
ncbi:hypothetical protein ElyMa_003662300 [Elysia marginata]|uniref:Uncharacterized protein n=1 Tax=Elysia marginata TaxID=1093978 RepID=A0AAV4EXY3_9GAST|nr:hypothetical protein ElyMa_003662300 [Elysia marginata]